MIPNCPNCERPMSPHGAKQVYQLGGLYEPWLCLSCHVYIYVLPDPHDTVNPFEPNSPGAHSGTYEEYESTLPSLTEEDLLGYGY